MSYPDPVVRLMAPIVQAVEAAILPDLQAAELAQAQILFPEQTESNIVGINYQFGHLKEIIETLKQYEYSPDHRDRKYPMIALFLDIQENYGNSGGYPGQCSLQMAICYHTQPTLKAEERYAQNFTPILLPIYEEFIRQMECSSGFVVMGKPQHTMTEHPYWGKGGLQDHAGNVFADYVDAIEIKDLQLTINFPTC